jgi:riboflavin synthase
MFTGIIKEVAPVNSVKKDGKILKYSVLSSNFAKTTQLGASIAIDGVCQTVTQIEKDCLHFDAIDETLKKTTLGKLKLDQNVHLEPALAFGDPLDGHLVSGHVDSVCKVIKIDKTPGRFDLTVSIPNGLSKYILSGGSICLSGVSLTLFNVKETSCSVSLIPETLERTHFGSLTPSSTLNIEVDSIGKWIEKLMKYRDGNSPYESKLKSFLE